MDTDLNDEFEALTQFLYMAPVGLVQIARDGEILMINPISAQLLMPLSTDGGLSNLFTALQGLVPDLRQRVQQYGADHGVVCDGLHVQVSAGQRGMADGRVLSLSLVKLDPQRLMAVLSDITEQVKRERLLRQNEAWFNAVLTGISDYSLARLDAQGRIDEWNPTIGRLTGLSEEAVIGQSYAVLYPAESTTAERVLDRLNEADSNGWSMDEGWRVKAGGGRFWGSTMIVPLRIAAQELGTDSGIHLTSQEEPSYCLVLRDITDKRETLEQQRRATLCDHLTGLANRRAFFEATGLELERWHRKPRPVCLLMIDADHFKQVNDRHGHPAGDAVLRHLAGVLSATIRQVDVAARIGGEEFAVLLPSTELAGACAVAERVRLAVAAAPVMVDGVAIPVTLSIGVALMDEHCSGADALLKRADQALYEAKRGGRNQVRAAAAGHAQPAAGGRGERGTMRA